MYELTFTNEYNESYTITQNNNFRMQYLDGFYSSSASISTTKVGRKAGTKFASRTVDERNLGIYFYIMRDVEVNRIDLYRIFRGSGKITVHYKSATRNVTIDGYVDDLNINPNNNPTTVQVIILCPYPYFKSIDKIIEEISIVERNFAFPFSYEEEGDAFSYIQDSAEETVVNLGNNEVGMTIELNAIADVTNPIIYNRETNEFFGIGNDSTEFNMYAGDLVTIDTKNKTVYLNRKGENINIFNYIRTDSKWLTLKPGDNLFTYTAQDNNIASLELYFHHQDEYEGV